MPANITYKGELLTSVNNNQAKVLKTKGTYLEDDVTIAEVSEVLSLQEKTITINNAGTTTVTPDSGYDGLSEVEVSVPEAEPFVYFGDNEFFSEQETSERYWRIFPKVEIETSEGDVAGWLDDGYRKDGEYYECPAIPTNTVITPTESTQTIGGARYMMEGTVTISPITSTYVGSGITTQSSLTVNANTITANAGYYANTVTYTMPYARLNTERTFTVNPGQISVDENSGIVTVAAITSGVGTVRTHQTSGYVNAIDSSNESNSLLHYRHQVTGATYQLPTLPAQSFTPSSSTQTVASTGKYMLGDITVEPIPSEYVVPTGTLTITHAGTTSVANYANVDVPEVGMFGGLNYRYKTENNVRKWEVSSNIIVDPEEGGNAGWVDEGVYPGITATYSAVPSGITITPTQTIQTIGGTNYMMEGPVTVASVPIGYLKGMLAMPVDIDFSSGTTPTETWTVEPSGMIIYQCYGTGAITNVVYSSGYIENTQQIPTSYEAGGSYQLPTQGATTVTPSETTQTLSINQKYMTGNVTVAAITSTYVGSGITRNPTITVSGPSVTIPAGYYSSQQTKTIANGTVGLGIEATVESSPSITVNANGLITAINNSSDQVLIVVDPGYISGNTTGGVGIAGEATYQLSIQGATTVTPSASTQTINVTGKYMTGNVTVNPIPSQYIVPSGTYTISSVDSTNTFNVTNYASAQVTITNADNIAY